MTWRITETGFGPLSWAAWIAIGTGVLALGTWALAGVTWYLAWRSQQEARGQVKAIRETAREQVAAAEQSAREQRDVTERMAQAHIDTLREDLRARLLLHYQTQWDSAGMLEQRKRLAGVLLSTVHKDQPVTYGSVNDDVPNFFESIGLAHRRGQLDTEMVWHTFGYYASRYGQPLGSFFVNDRNEHGDSHLWTGFLDLLAALRTFEETHLKRAHPDFPREELMRFFREEMLAPPPPIAYQTRPNR